MEQKEILPCPFCGGHAALHLNDGPLQDQIVQTDGGLYVRLFVQCLVCAATGASVEGRVYDQGILSVVVDGAVLKWNTRATPRHIDIEQAVITRADVALAIGHANKAIESFFSGDAVKWNR